jgi:hypothetical protein
MDEVQKQWIKLIDSGWNKSLILQNLFQLSLSLSFNFFHVTIIIRYEIFGLKYGFIKFVRQCEIFPEFKG